MGRCAIQIVMGPAGSGKSTYCHAIQQHCATLTGLRNRRVHVANLDPAAENFNYEVAFDVRDLISVDDVMEELDLGPNGGLVYCMEYLLENLEWLQERLEEYEDDEYLILDCPGQLELYTHVPVMRRILDQMKIWGFESSMVSIFVIDATFVCDTSKFISGSLLSLSAMIALELPHVNILSKCDLVNEDSIEKMLNMESSTQLWNTEQERLDMLTTRQEDIDFGSNSANEGDGNQNYNSYSQQKVMKGKKPKPNRFYKLTEAICSLLDDYSMVSFLPLNIKNEDSIDHVLTVVDHSIQYGENLEVRGAEKDDVFVGPTYGGED